MIYRVLIAGSRSFNDYISLEHTVDLIIRDYIPLVTIIQGECNGPDLMGKTYAINRGLLHEDYPANWYPNGPNGLMDKSAGHKRNYHMAQQNLSTAIFFWDGISRGTLGMINLIKGKRLPYYILKYNQVRHDSKIILEVWTPDPDPNSDNYRLEKYLWPDVLEGGF